MTTKMKGLLKGLRYISQMFDSKEHEMQIGYPTDVKHVAHIGWDGPSVNPPSWMNEFRSAPLSTLGGDALAEELPLRLAQSHDLNVSSGGGPEDRAPEAVAADPPVPKPRRHSSTGNAEGSTRSAGAPPRRRRNKSIADSVDGGGSVSSTPADSPAREGAPLIPKGGRKKKAKAGGTAADGGSNRSAKSRAPASQSDGGGSGGGVGQPQEGNTEDHPVDHSPRRGEGL